MGFTALLLTAVALAMDAVAVALASGLSVKPVRTQDVVSSREVRARDALAMAAVFGFLQGAMPVAGYWLAASLGVVLADTMRALDHWIAFSLLAALGAKMIIESREAAEPAPHQTEHASLRSPFGFKRLIALGVATSIDAFAVGIGFAVLDVGLLQAALVIGLTTFALCLPAVWFGARLGRRMGARVAAHAEVFGGVVLIGIGCKILYEHLSLGI
jgi:manganese efflux pump family protein